ncbi:hypothetical protein [Neptuniibacter sp. QD37_11]|uniref:hypothetical protein n=1 Tax=Neptuniibacter sp. QD37_11 TaxID=3398209 RepID=UPI0039F4CBD7
MKYFRISEKGSGKTLKYFPVTEDGQILLRDWLLGRDKKGTGSPVEVERVELLSLEESMEGLAKVFSDTAFLLEKYESPIQESPTSQAYRTCANAILEVLNGDGSSVTELLEMTEALRVDEISNAEVFRREMTRCRGMESLIQGV